MRLALLTNFIAPYRVPLLEALQDRVRELRIFVSTPMEEDRDWAVDWGGLDVVVQRNVTLHQRQRDQAGFSSRLMIHLPYDTIPQLWRYRPDVVISGELGARSLQAALHRRLRSHTRLLIWATLSERTERGRGAVRHRLRQAILHGADGVLVNGESGARYIGGFGVPDDVIFRINQPVDVQLFSQAAGGKPADAPLRLLHSGQLIARKGVTGFTAALVRWAALHPNQALEMWWVGQGDQLSALQGMTLPPNLAQRFLGSLPYAALPGVYAQCDLLAFPTLADEWGLVVNEAMAAGLPVLGSIHGQAVQELVTEGSTGWIFDPLDEASMMAGLDRALASPRMRLAAMGQAARARIATLTPTTAADRILLAIQAVMNGGALAAGGIGRIGGSSEAESA